MKQIEKLKENQQEIENIFCNKCGVSCRGTNNSLNGLIEAEVFGGYDSTHLSDGDVYCFSLCEFCLKIMFKDFIFPARQGNLFHPDNYMPNFDRRKYLGEGVKFWTDLTDEERASWRELLEKDSTLDYMKEVPREELIIWLYDLEVKLEKDEDDNRTIKAIRDQLQGRK